MFIIIYWLFFQYTCTVVDCGALTHPLSGQVNISSGTTYNQVAIYSCDTGYNLVGSPSRICQANGMWSSTAPSCECEYIRVFRKYFALVLSAHFSVSPQSLRT